MMQEPRIDGEEIRVETDESAMGNGTQPLPTEEPVSAAGEVVQEGTPEEMEAWMRSLSRRSFLWAGGIALSTILGFAAFDKYGGESDGINATLRGILDANGDVADRLFFSPRHMAPEFARTDAREPRNNYKGETPIIDLKAWRLKMDGLGTGEEPRLLTLADIKALPRVTQTTELKCVEGWSVVVNWTGARFVDLARKFPPPPGTQFVSMMSEPEEYPNEQYYVGLDLASCLHPQTLLAYEMNDKPLTAEHGAPLRLVMPHKYGIKNIKLITTISYADARPADYWFEQGYDYYAGL